MAWTYVVWWYEGRTRQQGWLIQASLNPLKFMKMWKMRILAPLSMSTVCCKILCYVMLCCVVLCLCCVVSCRVVLRCVISYRTVMMSYIMSCLALSCPVLSYHIMSCPVLSCHAMPCHALPCHVMSCHVMSCHVMSCNVMSCQTIYHIIYHIIFTDTCIFTLFHPINCQCHYIQRCLWWAGNLQMVLWSYDDIWFQSSEICYWLKRGYVHICMDFSTVAGQTFRSKPSKTQDTGSAMSRCW